MTIDVKLDLKTYYELRDTEKVKETTKTLKAEKNEVLKKKRLRKGLRL